MCSSQVIHWKQISYFKLWWLHEKKSKILKFEYLKKERSFDMKQKTFFQVSKALFFRVKKQNSETISDIVLILAYLLFYFKNML